MTRALLVVAFALACAAGCLDPTAPRRQAVSTAGGGSTAALAFTVQPSSVVAGQIITPAIQVTARDSLGRQDSTFTGSVTVAIGTNPVGGTLGGTRTVAAVAGIASFGDLTVNRAATGYTLTAAAPGASGATSAAFNVTEPDRSVRR